MPHDSLSPARARERDTGEFVVRHVTSLDGWLAHTWDAGIRTDRIEPLETMRVETRNSTYELAVVAGRDGHVMVRGGRYFPQWTAVSYLGCSLGGALLMRHMVHPGFLMEFYWSGRRIVTSPVRRVTRDLVSGSAAIS